VASNRKTIIDAFVSACEGISGVRGVSQNYETWWEKPAHEFPFITVRDTETTLDRHSYLSSADDDMEANLEIVATGYVHDMNNVLATKRTDLIKSIESTVVDDTTLGGLTLSVTPMSINTDDGGIDNYSICDVVFNIQYIYNHSSP
jgi:hypothetical protein